MNSHKTLDLSHLKYETDAEALPEFISTLIFHLHFKEGARNLLRGNAPTQVMPLCNKNLNYSVWDN